MPCGIEYDINEWFASDGIGLFQYIGGNFNKEGVELALIPLVEDFAHFCRSQTEDILHKVVGFTNHLHVAIFDTIVHHFYIVTSTIRADVCGATETAFDWFARFGTFEWLAGFRINLGRDGFPDWLQV